MNFSSERLWQSIPMEFKKSQIDTKPSGDWRLASVDEVRSNLDEIKKNGTLESWDIARLLDGWVDGPGYRYTIKNEYKPNMGHMLLVKTKVSRSSDGSFTKEMYEGVKLSNEGREAALLLSCEDKTTEIICLVLQSIVDSFEAPDKRQAELDRLTTSLDKTFRNKRTVLHYAADEPHSAKHAEYVAELLLDKFEFGKEVIKATDKFGRSALHLAALHGHIELCKFLMEKCKLKGDEKNRNDENLLHFAVNSNDVDLVKTLCELDEVKRLINSQDLKGKTPLHKAAAKGNKDMMEVLLSQIIEKDKIAYVRQDDLFGQTALHEAVSGGHMEAVSFLLQNESRPIAERNSDGKTALHYAVQVNDEGKQVEMATLLLKKCTSDEERSLLLWASASGIGTAEKSAQPLSPVQIYLQRQRELTKKSSEDLLSSAIKLEREDIAWELINRGAKTHCLTNCSDSDHKLRKNVNNFRERIKKIPERGRDQPTIEDSLGRRAFAEGLAALFLNPYVKTPVTVGITGDWGMGKSSLMMQTEMILVKTGAQLAFPNLLPTEEFPGSGQFELSPKGRRKYYKIKEAVTDLLVSEEFTDADQQIKEAVTDLLESEEFIVLGAQSELSPEGIKKCQKIKEEITSVVKEIVDSYPKGRRNYQKFIEKVTDLFASKEFTIQEADVKLSTNDRRKYQKIKESVTDLLANAHPLLYLLNNYQDKHYEVYRSLAAMDRSEIFHVEGETQDSSNNQYSLGKIPNILTVRYNAWHYKTESEAWAGLAVNITKVIEETMTRAQRIRCRWSYAWRGERDKLLFGLFLPCLLALVFSGWLAWAVWMLLSRSKHKEVVHLKYGSIPVTVVIIVWTILKQLVSVLKPISVQIMGYASLPDHTRNLGYQHQVISDINFLKDQMGEKPSRFWKFMAFEWLWRLCGLYPDTVKGTSIPKSPPPCKHDVRIIVFVDDLDRCQDTVILQVLSAVNLVLAACGINVILGMDKKMIARAIANKFQDSDNQDMVDPVDFAEKYISKIVQLPLALPDPDNDETKNFLDNLLGEGFVEGTTIAERAQSVASSNDAQCSEEHSLDRPTDVLPIQCSDNREQAHTVVSVQDEGSSEWETNSNVRKQTPTGENLGEAQSSDVTDMDHGTRDGAQNLRLLGSGDFWSKHSRLIKPLRMFRNILCGYLSGLCGIPTGFGDERLKLQSTLLNSQRMMPTYSFRERKVIYDLRTLTTDTHKLPREWKQFLTYHRLAWNILSQSDRVQNLPGWQVQLLVWIFCCWQWKDKINNIIEKWNEIVNVNGGSLSDEELSLLHIVERYIEEILSPHPLNNDSSRSQGGEMKKVDRQEKKKKDEEDKKKEEEEEQMKKEEEEEKKNQDKKNKRQDKNRLIVGGSVPQNDLHTVRPRPYTKRNGRQLSRVGLSIPPPMEKAAVGLGPSPHEERCCWEKEAKKQQRYDKKKNQEEEKAEEDKKRNKEEEEENKKQDKKENEKEEEEKENEEDEVKKKLDKMKKKEEEGIAKIEMEDEKKKIEWKKLKETLLKYDVSMDCIQFFQKFRLHCEVGHLPWQKQALTKPIETSSTSDPTSLNSNIV